MSRVNSRPANKFVLVAGLLLFTKALTYAFTRLSSIARDEVLHQAGGPHSSLRNGPS